MAKFKVNPSTVVVKTRTEQMMSVAKNITDLRLRYDHYLITGHRGTLSHFVNAPSSKLETVK